MHSAADSRCLVAATATPVSTLCTAGTLTDQVNMTQEGIGDRVAAETHDRIGKLGALIGLDPGFNIAAAAQ